MLLSKMDQFHFYGEMISIKSKPKTKKCAEVEARGSRTSYHLISGYVQDYGQY